MFGLFKRTKVKPWEVELLKNVLKKLPVEFGMYIEQINLGLFNGITVGNAAIPGYVGFTNDPDIYDAINDVKGRDFEMNNINVYDTISHSYLQYAIFFRLVRLMGIL
jgi:hypothetical protein